MPILKGNLVIAVCAAFLTGCAGTPTYPGLTRGQFAVLDLGGSWAKAWTGDAVWVTQVDGHAAPSDTQFHEGPHDFGGPAMITLLPGHHTISCIPGALHTGGSAISKDIDVEAGKTYRVRMVQSNMQLVSQQRLGTSITAQYQGSWSVEVTEEK